MADIVRHLEAPVTAVGAPQHAVIGFRGTIAAGCVLVAIAFGGFGSWAALAPLSSAVEPFVPPVLGTGLVGQFKTVATAGAGLWLATGASVVLIAALFFHRRAYLPLVRATRVPRSETSTNPASETQTA